MTRLLFRTLLVVAAAAYLAGVVVNYSGQWALDHPTMENLERGMRFNPTNPQLWTAFGRRLLYDPEGTQPQNAVGFFLLAAERNPVEPENWENLADAFQQLGDFPKSEKALRAGLEAAPHSPEAAWRFGNFLLLRGRQTEALPYLKTAASSEWKLRAAVFDQGWKILGEPESVLREVVPPALEARADYLRFLLARNRLLGSYPVWEELRSGHFPDAVNLGYAYVDALVVAGLRAEAVRVWDELLEDTGRRAAKPEGELLTNGDFELDLPNAGLDWRLTKAPGYQIVLDNFVFQHGSRSLRVTFDGSLNPDFAAVWETVPVEPSREYRFRGYLKTENITSDSGLRFMVAAISGQPDERFVLYTQDQVGGNPWTPAQLDFHTGSKTHAVTVALRRLPSRKLNNLLQGQVWIDHLSLQVR